MKQQFIFPKSNYAYAIIFSVLTMLDVIAIVAQVANLEKAGISGFIYLGVLIVSALLFAWEASRAIKEVKARQEEK